MSTRLFVLCSLLSGAMWASGSPKQSGRARITGIDHVTIYVSDIEKSRRFYSDVLGLTVGCPQYSGSETCLHVDPSEQYVLLKPLSTKIRMDAHKSWLAEITFATDDVWDLRQYLRTHGLHPGPTQKESDGAQYFRVLQVPDGPDWIEYMLNIPANADHKELGVQNHFSFGVKDVHAAAAELRSRGYQTFDGPEVGRDGKDSLDAYDPDDTRVEIMELTPVQKPCCHPYTAEHPKP